MNETRFRDRDKWPKGPWDDEPDHMEARWKDFPMIIHRNPMGAWCGYVGVPPGHPWHKKEYDDVPADVHGDLTYARKCTDDICHVPKPGESDNVWWLGFDCLHSGDQAPGMLASDQFMRDIGYKGFGQYRSKDKYRDVGYVITETTKLAQQAELAAAAQGGSN